MLPGFTADTDPGRALKANLPSLCGCCPLRAAARKMKGFAGGHPHGQDPLDRVDVLRPPCCYSRRVNHFAAASSQLSFRHPSSIAGSGLESLRVSFPRAQEGLSRTAPPPLSPFLPHASQNMAEMGRPRCPRQLFLSQFLNCTSETQPPSMGSPGHGVEGGVGEELSRVTNDSPRNPCTRDEGKLAAFGRP